MTLVETFEHPIRLASRQSGSSMVSFWASWSKVEVFLNLDRLKRVRYPSKFKDGQQMGTFVQVLIH